MLRPKVSFKERKAEWEKFKKEMAKVHGAKVTIGLHEGAGEYDDGVSVVQVAFWNEFGAEHIPARSFIRSVVDEKATMINKWRQDSLAEIAEGKLTTEKALESIGFKIRELIRNKIMSNIPPPNADSTIAAKKRAGIAPRTLVENGLLMRSVEYKVVMK